MMPHLPHRTIPLCVRDRPSPCIHPTYVCVACTPDITGLCKEEGMLKCLEASALVQPLTATVSLEPLQRG